MPHLVAPSVLSADFANLQRDIEMLNNSIADYIHCDVMDGRFVPNITFGFDILKSIRRHATKPLDVHLMIEQPERYIERFAEAGAAIISVHLEACPHLHRTLQQIKATGAKAGIAINPHSPIHLLEDILPEADLVCLMAVNPGFGGQHFIEHTYTKITRLQNLRHTLQCHTLIEIDGGVTLTNAPLLLKAGSDVLVAGNTVFSNTDPSGIIAQLKTINP
jgi:ribulose-phosphate 3-epimerase